MEHPPQHICIFTESHLAKAPRVVKEANVYADAGYRVTVFSSWYDKTLLEMDRALLHPSILHKAGTDLLNWNGVKSIIIRLKRLLGRNLVKYVGLQTVTAIGYDFKNYLKRLEQEEADFYIGHQELGMALSKALILKGNKVAFDFEDWHSKDLLPKDRAYRPLQLLEQLEAYLLQHASYCYTTSEAMAKALSEYHHTKPPMVVYNSFLASQRATMDGLQKDRPHHDTPSVYWFSQVIGKGRGLELLFEALPFVTTAFQLHLRGMISESYRDELQEKTPAHISLYVHDVVPPYELISRIAEHDLGIAFEEQHPESRNYTITNKVFHYLQSGIAILATNTAGQLEIAKKSTETISIVERHPNTIAGALQTILNDKTTLKLKKEASWYAGEENFAFENQAKQLLRMLKQELTY